MYCKAIEQWVLTTIYSCTHSDYTPKLDSIIRRCFQTWQLYFQVLLRLSLALLYLCRVAPNASWCAYWQCLQWLQLGEMFAVLRGVPNGDCISPINSGSWPPSLRSLTTLTYTQRLTVTDIRSADAEAFISTGSMSWLWSDWFCSVHVCRLQALVEHISEYLVHVQNRWYSNPHTPIWLLIKSRIVRCHQLEGRYPTILWWVCSNRMSSPLIIHRNK